MPPLDARAQAAQRAFTRISFLILIIMRMYFFVFIAIEHDTLRQLRQLPQ